MGSQETMSGAVFESCKGESRLKRHPGLAFRPDAQCQGMRLLQVYRDIPEQEITGFGGAFTQSAASVFAQMPPERQDEILKMLFSKDGLAYNRGRIPIGACDFSDGNYSYCDRLDLSLDSFSLERDEELVLPFIKQAMAYSPEMTLMGSPWSPPAWMKTNGDMCHGGELKEECYGVYARYMVRYLLACKQAGVSIGLVSTQNEPKATQTWESCLYSAEQEADFIVGFLAPALEEAGLGDVGIIIWDHNKERVFLRAKAILSQDGLRDVVKGIAFHWYSGDHFENLALCRRFFPQMELLFTEGCVELCAQNTTIAAKAEEAGRQSAAEKAPWEFGEFYSHEIIGNLNAGMNGFMDWNLLLDAQGGPNHVGNYCSAPLICDTKTGIIYPQPSYYHISHFSRFLPRGSRRLSISRYTDEIEAVAAQSPDGTMTLVAMNAGNKPISMTISDVSADALADWELKPHSIITAQWR